MSQGEWVTVVSVVLAIAPAVTGAVWFIWRSGRDDASE